MFDKFLWSVCLSFLATLGLAQTETLAGASGSGGFGGPIMELSRIAGVNGVSVGGGGAAIFGNVFFGGFGQSGGFGSVTLDGQRYDVSLGVGGLWLGYTHRQQKLIHPYASLRFGWGGIQVRAEEDPDDVLPRYHRSVTVLQPEVGAELNLTHWFRLAVTAGYRMAHGVRNLPGGLGPDDFNSFTGNLVFRFGGFPD